MPLSREVRRIARMMPLDWTDIALHGAVATVVMLILARLGWWVVPLNATFWLGRELWQHSHNWTAPFTHPQSLLEWVIPTVLGFAVYAFINRTRS
jgi:hypothetical protein